MSRYKSNSYWLDIDLRKLAGSAIAIEAANAAEIIFDRISLVHEIEKRSNWKTTLNVEKMIKGTLPENDTCLKIQGLLNCNSLTYWKNHPFWPLLSKHHFEPKFVQLALESVKGDIQRYVWNIWPEEDEDFKSPRKETSLDLIKTVASFENISALIVLTAWAREARYSNILRPNYQASLYCRKIFARVICRTPHLFIRWPTLALRYKSLIWSFPESDVSVPWMKNRWEELYDEILEEEKLARGSEVNLPPKREFRRINKSELSSYFDNT